MPILTLGINNLTWLEAPKTAQHSKLRPTFNKPISVICGLWSLKSMTCSFLRSSIYVGFPSLVMNTLLITPHSLQMNTRHSAHCIAVGVCFCFHQLLPEDCRISYKVVINLIIWEWHWGYPVYYRLESYLVSCLYMSGHSPSDKKQENMSHKMNLKRLIKDQRKWSGYHGVCTALWHELGKNDLVVQLGLFLGYLSVVPVVSLTLLPNLGPLTSTGLPRSVLYEGLCLVLLHLVLMCWVGIPGRPSLFWMEREYQWIWVNEYWGDCWKEWS